MFAMERVPGTLLSLEMFSSWVRGGGRGRVGVGVRGRVGVRVDLRARIGGALDLDVAAVGALLHRALVGVRVGVRAGVRAGTGIGVVRV